MYNHGANSIISDVPLSRFLWTERMFAGGIAWNLWKKAIISLQKQMAIGETITNANDVAFLSWTWQSQLRQLQESVWIWILWTRLFCAGGI